MHALYNLFLLPLFLTLTLAFPSPVHVRDTANKKPTPTRPFTIAAFESPYPANSNATGSHGVSGVLLTAREGAFWVDPQDQTPTTVVWVDELGQAWLVCFDSYLTTSEKDTS
jgi:hypothetical protein